MSRSSVCHALLGLFILTLIAPGLIGTGPQAVGQNLTWSGSSSTNWNFSDPNWNLNGMVNSPTSFNNGAVVTFDDTAIPGTTAITVSNFTVQPGSVVFNNDVLLYSFSGGAIAGPGSVTLSGTARVVFSSANTYTGGTCIENAELLQLAGGASLGTGGLTVDAGTLDLGGNNQAVMNFNGLAGTIISSGGAGTLTVGPTSASAFGGALQNGSGTLSLAMNGPGLLTLSGSNSYSGGTVLSGGTLDITNAASLGISSGKLAIGPATLEVSGIIASTRSITLSSSAAAISVDAARCSTTAESFPATAACP